MERSIEASYRRVSFVSDLPLHYLLIVSFVLDEINMLTLSGSKYHRS